MNEHTESATSRPIIVVGNDGSPAAKPALEWAVDEAERRGADLEVVIAWEYPYAWAEGFNSKWADDCAEFASHAKDTADRAVQDVLVGRERPSWIHTRAVQGLAARALLDCSAHADLLVVGSRGRGGFAGLLLGSVSTACVHHTHCPVTVVPAPSAER